MVILLDGASQTVRATIALQATKRHPHWQHLALESMQGASGTVEERALHLGLIRRCAQELAEQHLHLLLTLPAETRQTVEIATALRPDVITIHLGEEDADDYDRVLPLSVTLPDVLAVLDTYMKNA
jgi:hypothetical protein